MKVSIEVSDSRKARDVIMFLALIEGKVELPDADALWDMLCSLTESLGIFLEFPPREFFPLNRDKEWRDIAEYLIRQGQEIHAIYNDLLEDQNDQEKTDES